MENELREIQEGPHGWKEILAEAFVSFFLSAPVSAKELFRRILVVLILAMFSGGAYVVIREPEVLALLTGRSIQEQSITQRMRHARSRVEKSLEDWFYANRPVGLLLVSWEDRTTLRTVWAQPESVLHGRMGIKQVATEIKSWAGPFVFGECVVSDFIEIRGAKITACPILNDHDVWGYVAIVYNPGEEAGELARKALKDLAHELNGILY